IDARGGHFRRAGIVCEVSKSFQCCDASSPTHSKRSAREGTSDYSLLQDCKGLSENCVLILALRNRGVSASVGVRVQNRDAFQQRINVVADVRFITKFRIRVKVTQCRKRYLYLSLLSNASCVV